MYIVIGSDGQPFFLFWTVFLYLFLRNFLLVTVYQQKTRNKAKLYSAIALFLLFSPFSIKLPMWTPLLETEYLRYTSKSTCICFLLVPFYYALQFSFFLCSIYISQLHPCFTSSSPSSFYVLTTCFIPIRSGLMIPIRLNFFIPFCHTFFLRNLFS